MKDYRDYFLIKAFSKQSYRDHFNSGEGMYLNSVEYFHSHGDSFQQDFEGGIFRQASSGQGVLVFSKEQNTYNFKGLLFILISGILATFIRYVGSNVSSIVVYGYTLKAALAYNSFYIPLSGAVSIAALMAIYGPLAKINNTYPVISDNQKSVKE